MDNKIEMYKEMVLKGEKLEKEQAMELLTVDLDELCKAADEIRACLVGRELCIRDSYKQY